MRQTLSLLRRSASALFVLALSALAAAPVQAAPEVIRIGVATAGGGEPVTWGGSPGGVVRVNNWLEEEFKASGIKVEWLFFKGAGPAVNEALSNKQIDFAYQGDLPSIVVVEGFCYEFAGGHGFIPVNQDLPAHAIP